MTVSGCMVSGGNAHASDWGSPYVGCVWMVSIFIQQCVEC